VEQPLSAPRGQPCGGNYQLGSANNLLCDLGKTTSLAMNNNTNKNNKKIIIDKMYSMISLHYY
jgi:hypothetical protein